MDSLAKKIELLANVAIVVVAALLCVVLVKSYLLPSPAPGTAAGPGGSRELLERGEPVAVSGIDWRKNGKTLLLALSTTCRFCTESAPFYQRVVKERGGAGLVALFPQEAEEGRAYLGKLGVGINDVLKVPVNEIGLRGTPTLVLVDSAGVATDVWVGALTPEQEDEVVSDLRADLEGGAPAPSESDGRQQ